MKRLFLKYYLHSAGQRVQSYTLSLKFNPQNFFSQRPYFSCEYYRYKRDNYKAENEENYPPQSAALLSSSRLCVADIVYAQHAPAGKNSAKNKAYPAYGHAHSRYNAATPSDYKQTSPQNSINVSALFHNGYGLVCVVVYNFVFHNFLLCGLVNLLYSQ